MFANENNNKRKENCNQKNVRIKKHGTRRLMSFQTKTGDAVWQISFPVQATSNHL